MAWKEEFEAALAQLAAEKGHKVEDYVALVHRFAHGIEVDNNHDDRKEMYEEDDKEEVKREREWGDPHFKLEPKRWVDDRTVYINFKVRYADGSVVLQVFEGLIYDVSYGLERGKGPDYRHYSKDFIATDKEEAEQRYLGYVNEAICHAIKEPGTVVPIRPLFPFSTWVSRHKDGTFRIRINLAPPQLGPFTHAHYITIHFEKGVYQVWAEGGDQNYPEIFTRGVFDGNQVVWEEVK